MKQLRLSFGFDERYVRTFLEKRTGRKIELILTENRSSVISCRESEEGLILRLHRMFLNSDDDLLDELAGFMLNRRKKTPLIRSFINSRSAVVSGCSGLHGEMLTQGRHHNLARIFSRINDEYFDGGIRSRITWGRKGTRRFAKCRTLGSYCPDCDLIRINTILDSRRVPRYFVEYIVYHEMLHADLGVAGGAQRRRVHTPEFKKRERTFRHYDKAIAWERNRF
jgi:hypothetical protein